MGGIDEPEAKEDGYIKLFANIFGSSLYLRNCSGFFLHRSLFWASPFFPIHSGENADVVIADL